MAEARRKGHTISFDVLYLSKETNYCAARAEIGEKEGEYIRRYKPILNTQIPKEEDWHSYEYNNVNAKEILNRIL